MTVRLRRRAGVQRSHPRRFSTIAPHALNAGDERILMRTRRARLCRYRPTGVPPSRPRSHVDAACAESVLTGVAAAHYLDANPVALTDLRGGDAGDTAGSQHHRCADRARRTNPPASLHVTHRNNLQPEDLGLACTDYRMLPPPFALVKTKFEIFHRGEFPPAPQGQPWTSAPTEHRAASDGRRRSAFPCPALRTRVRPRRSVRTALREVARRDAEAPLATAVLLTQSPSPPHS